MNRLILIGNGFDLAHGFKTSYHDFMLSYLKECCISAVNNQGALEVGRNATRIDTRYLYEDVLVKIQLKNRYSNVNYQQFIDNCNTINELFDFMKHYEIFKNFKSAFFNDTIEHCQKFNWVDIENEYFKKLLKNVDQCVSNRTRNNNYKQDLLLLNNQLQYLSDKLHQYLSALGIKNAASGRAIAQLMLEDIKQDEVVTVNLENNRKPNNLYLLNFNYTKTTSTYYIFLNKHIPSEVNHIHGELSRDDNPLIFGFGDEIDKSYKQIEELNENEYFRHIKSFKYFKTSNYHDLIRFTESDDFQVYIMGHSCGLSDRTLLNQIFEHDNCKSIKIFYYSRPDGSNDFIEKTFEISRHFHDKGVMRKKIVPLEKSSPLPQV